MLQNRNSLICLVGILVCVSWNLGIHLDEIRCWLKLKANILLMLETTLGPRKFILTCFPREWGLSKTTENSYSWKPCCQANAIGRGPRVASFSSDSQGLSEFSLKLLGQVLEPLRLIEGVRRKLGKEKGDWNNSCNSISEELPSLGLFSNLAEFLEALSAFGAWLFFLFLLFHQERGRALEE